MEVHVLKSQGNKSRRKNDKGPQDMEVDCIKSVTTDLASKACQPKDVLTKVELPGEQPQTSESHVQEPDVVTTVSVIPHVSLEENVGKFHNMRKDQDF